MPDFMQELAEQVSNDIMACIGCNDCLLACPLPESRNVTIAELNHAVNDEFITAENVIQFVNQCTQCRQCVPACPADLRRADIVLWNQITVQNVSPDTAIPLQAGEKILDSSWTLDTLASHLRGVPLFRGMDQAVLRRRLLAVTLRQLAPGEVLVKQGDFHERLLVVLSGSLEQSAIDAEGVRTRILVLGPGSFHGVTSVMGQNQEPFAISAIGPTIIVEFTKAAVVRLMKESEEFNETMQSAYQNASIWNQANQSPLFAAMPDDAVADLLEKATLRVLTEGEVLYREGDDPTAIYIVRSGFLRVARRFGAAERVLQYFRDGDVCGASAILFDQSQSATVSANTRSEVIEIPADEVRDFIGQRPTLRDELATEAGRAEQFLTQSGARPTPKANPTAHLMSLEGLLDEGVMQGHHVLLINTAICTNCNNCVDSCERRHGYSRLDRSGLQLGEMLFPTACRHCEDPKCLLCSVSGIVREPDGEIRIVADNCIGCGACAERCPYGNINMHEEQDKGRSSSKGGLFSLFSSGGDSDDIHHAHGKGNRVAVKCDLCAGYDDYACVRGCPVGAAMRVDPVELFGRDDVLIGLENQGGVLGAQKIVGSSE